MKLDPFGIEISDALERMKKSHEQLLNQIKKNKPISREEMIQNDYFKFLKKETPWISSLSNKDIKLKVEFSKFEQKNELLAVESVINKIKQHSELKMIVISDFLKQFPEITDVDRQVLMEDFNSLDLTHLKAELEKIKELFK